MLQAGDPAPDFALPNAVGETVRLSELRGRQVVLYFYPKDLTPACTRQACDLRDRHEELREAGVEVLGVSLDSARMHQKFTEKCSLPFQLLTDVEKEVATAYGVWKEKSLYGKTFMGIVRSTFLIDAEGKIARVWPKVRVAGHVEEVLAAAQAGAS
jgi:peroxiredoxin Q/BCP